MTARRPHIPWLTGSVGTRNIQLDVLRGLAILLVIGNHFITPPDSAGCLRPLALWLFRFGWTGVDLFFVLSGFLIGGLLFNEIRNSGTFDFRRFIIRRGLKIWPAYLVYILAVYALLVLFGDDTTGSALHRLVPNLLHLQNYLGSPRGHTWSLAVEEHFYLLLPLFLLIALRGKRNDTPLTAVPIAAIALMTLCTALRLGTALHLPFDFTTHQFPTHLRLDSLFFGVLLAYLRSFRPDLLKPFAHHRRLTALAGLALLTPLMMLELNTSILYQSLGLTMLYLGWGLILLAAVLRPPHVQPARATLPLKLLACTGYFSYSIYLWHLDLAWQPIRFLSRRGFLGLDSGPAAWIITMTLYTLLSIVTGALMARIVEMPILRLRDRLFPSRARALPASAGNGQAQ
ncbi:MAG: acyltransferase [bacterium]|nr:acyltransferase [bacterium]